MRGPELQAQSPKKAGNTQPSEPCRRKGQGLTQSLLITVPNYPREAKVRTRREMAKSTNLSREPAARDSSCQHRLSMEAAQAMMLASLPPPPFLSQLAYAHTSTCLIALES